ncbi:hypothetical protein WGH24286_00098 [Periweissella ghanensis]|uniref:Uncharacterized protein n=1 Tax=Periweissella ghanensis TaxID=467997 RepID=A0ABM8Z8P1_9LACO|nr:hypothetical protein WGH24286_00098 [Periweissella ghanensis]
MMNQRTKGAVLKKIWQRYIKIVALVFTTALTTIFGVRGLVDIIVLQEYLLKSYLDLTIKATIGAIVIFGIVAIYDSIKLMRQSKNKDG